MKKHLSVIILSALIIPQTTFAVWWNPSSWFRKAVTSPAPKILQVATTTQKIVEASTTVSQKNAPEKNKPKEEIHRPSTKITSDNQAIIQAEVQRQVKTALKVKADEEARIAQQKIDEQAKIDAVMKATLDKQAAQIAQQKAEQDAASLTAENEKAALKSFVAQLTEIFQNYDMNGYKGFLEALGDEKSHNYEKSAYEFKLAVSTACDSTQKSAQNLRVAYTNLPIEYTNASVYMEKAGYYLCQAQINYVLKDNDLTISNIKDANASSLIVFTFLLSAGSLPTQKYQSYSQEDKTSNTAPKIYSSPDTPKSTGNQDLQQQQNQLSNMQERFKIQDQKVAALNAKYAQDTKDNETNSGTIAFRGLRQAGIDKKYWSDLNAILAEYR